MHGAFVSRLVANVDGDSGFAADAFDQATAKTIIGVVLYFLDVGRDELKFESGAPGVEDEDVHGCG